MRRHRVQRPTSNIVSAAEHALGLMLACARKVPQANASMHEGKWERSKFTGVELYEKTLAIFGLGRIGGSWPSAHAPSA